MAQQAELLTAVEAGQMLGGVSDETVNRWARTGRIPCIQLPSGRRRFRKEDIEAILRGEHAGDSPS